MFSKLVDNKIIVSDANKTCSYHWYNFSEKSMENAKNVRWIGGEMTDHCNNAKRSFASANSLSSSWDAKPNFLPHEILPIYNNIGNDVYVEQHFFKKNLQKRCLLKKIVDKKSPRKC